MLVLPGRGEVRGAVGDGAAFGHTLSGVGDFSVAEFYGDFWRRDLARARLTMAFVQAELIGYEYKLGTTSTSRVSTTMESLSTSRVQGAREPQRCTKSSSRCTTD